MIVDIVSTGEEVLAGLVVDSNAAFIADRLVQAEVEVGRHICVGDREETIAAVLADCAARADAVVVTGGLGPTGDDCTAKAAAAAAGVPLVQNPRALAGVKRFFAGLGVAPGSSDEKQAFLPDGALCLDNPVGSAPGFRLKLGACTFFFLPGVPGEARRMMADHVMPWISACATDGDSRITVKTLSCFGLTEAAVGEKLATVSGAFPGVRMGTRVRFPAIDIRLAERRPSGSDSSSQLRPAVKEVTELLADHVYSRSGQSMQAEVGALLRRHSLRLALAESCTGGLISSMVTDVAGSSDYFLFSGVTYSNDAKTAVLGVSAETLDRYGAVHEETAKEMANGARRVSGADFGLSTSGIAGPGGGSPDKPVGTVCIGLSSAAGTKGYRYRFPFADRWKNKSVFAVTALNVLRKEILQARCGERPA